MHCSKTASLFDHLVGGYEQLVRHGETEHPGGLVIDDQLIRQFEGRSARFRTIQI
jgi:hypothetical protein